MEAYEPAPDAELFYSLYDGVFRPQIVQVSLKLGIFTALASGPLDAEVLAESVGANAEGIRKLAGYLVAIGLLDKVQGGYGLTPCAETFLARTSKAYAGDIVLGFTGPGLWDSVLRSGRSGEPAALLERFDQDAWVESYRTSRVVTSLEMWRAAGIAPKPQAEVTILDLACGCGVKSFCLAQAHSSVRVVCVDQPDVLVVAKDLAGRMGIAERVTLVSGDLINVELGNGVYDVCLAGQITHYLTEEQNAGVFCRIREALRDTGTFIIDVPMTDGEPDESAAFLSLVLWANSRGTAHSYEVYQRLLQTSGFKRVVQIGERWIAAEK